MFEMTEALIYHARFCVLNMTNADPVEIKRELETAMEFSYEAGRRAYQLLATWVPTPSG